jgi:hypothetical protein
MKSHLFSSAIQPALILTNLDRQNFTDCNKFHIDLTADEVETLRTNWGFAAQFSPCRKEH